jgi:aspartate/methionine/tyrosine aminotransferase
MSPIPPFKLERYFAQYEFTTRYSLSSSDCESLAMSELLKMADDECRGLWENLHLGYTESLGHPLLRAEVSRFYSSISSEDVLMLVPQEGILTAISTLLQPGDHIISIFPAYQSLFEVARSMGCQVSLWYTRLKDGRWQVDLDQLEDLITDKTRLLVVNFPHNPTGFLATREELDQIIALAAKYDLYLLSDEMYRFLEYDPGLRLPPAVDLYPKAISLSGLSKSFALPGLRTGWLVTQDKVLFQKFTLFKDYTTICGSAPGEILSLIALRSAEKLARRSYEIVNHNLGLAHRFFAGYNQVFEWIPPMAGSVAFPRFKLELPIEEFCRQVVEQVNILVVPGSMFDYPGNHFRLGLGRSNFPEAIKLFGEFLVRNFKETVPQAD